MAVRLQMKLGVVAEQDRLDDSPDTIVVVEPSVGSVARSKGHLYLLVTSQHGGHRALESTRLVAETIRNEYYYDESGGIRVCLERAIRQANKKIGHQRDRFGFGHAEDGNGPIGVGVAVVRGNELYVATVGPAEAYLIRQARLSTLPDPHRERGLPAGELEPDVWRGEISVGDSLVLTSPNVTARLGTDELKDAMVTLHPQSAMEHLHHRFVAADGHGSDGAIAFEATEVAATQKQRSLVPVRPAEPLAGAPERSPIPLAEPVAEGVAAVQAGASAARSAAGGLFGRAILRLQDFLPRRRQGYRRVTPLSTRREIQRRAAVAVLAFVVVAIGLGTAIYFVSAGGGLGAVLSSAQAGQKALDDARADVNRVFGPGIDLVADRPKDALPLLTDALDKLHKAQDLGIPASAIDPLRAQVNSGLDRLFHVVEVADKTFVRLKAAKTPNLEAVVRGPDGAAYVIDRTAKAVVRIDLHTKKTKTILHVGTHGLNGGTAATPKLIAVGGPDLVILDAKNTVWRWRPSNATGSGTLVRIAVPDSSTWGNDISAMGTFLKNAPAGLYNLYVVDPSQQQILAYAPRLDGGGYPAAANKWLDAARPVDKITALYIDGDLYVADDGKILRYVSGNGDTWKPQDIGDAAVRGTPRYTVIASGSQPRGGRLYAFDATAARIVAFDKGSGAFIEQYRLAGGSQALKDLRGMFVVPGADNKPSTLYWISAGELHVVSLVAVPPAPSASSSPPPAAPSPTPKKTKKP
jgi:hypothetical protein